jgi:hypothetical protein
MPATAAREGTMERDREELALMLLREGSRSQAIELYQEETGATIEDAEDAIGSLAASHGMGHPWPPLAVVLILISAIGGIAVAMAR